MSIAVPTNPIKTPVSCLRLNVNPNTIAPKSKVFNGVKAFKIEATELSILWSAKENKKTGKKEPNNAFSVKYFQCRFSILSNRLNPISNKKTAVIKIRKAPTWIGVRPIRAFFIKIKELPQINERIIK